MARLSEDVLKDMDKIIGHISILRKEGYEEVRYSVSDLIKLVREIRENEGK